MIRVLKPSAFVTSPWKNGGGITHEIARSGDKSGLIWRLSIAEVASDGPFSRFEGLSRILTVIEGEGLILHSPEQPIAARLLEPVAFSGDLPIDSRMIKGPIRDFNVIYDASRVAAAVLILRAGAGAHSSKPGTETAVLAHTGETLVGDQPLAAGSVALLTATSPGFDVHTRSTAIVVTFTPR